MLRMRTLMAAKRHMSARNVHRFGKYFAKWKDAYVHWGIAWPFVLRLLMALCQLFDGRSEYARLVTLLSPLFLFWLHIVIVCLSAYLCSTCLPAGPFAHMCLHAHVQTLDACTRARTNAHTQVRPMRNKIMFRVDRVQVGVLFFGIIVRQQRAHVSPDLFKALFWALSAALCFILYLRCGLLVGAILPNLYHCYNTTTQTPRAPAALWWSQRCLPAGVGAEHQWPMLTGPSDETFPSH